MRSATLIAGSLLLACSAGLAGAAPAYDRCAGVVTGIGRALHGQNFDPPRNDNTESLARQRAIADWSAKVRASCPRSSARWLIAARKRITCDGYAGGIGCGAIAHTRRRLF